MAYLYRVIRLGFLFGALLGANSAFAGLWSINTAAVCASTVPIVFTGVPLSTIGSAAAAAATAANCQDVSSYSATVNESTGQIFLTCSYTNNSTAFCGGTLQATAYVPPNTPPIILTPADIACKSLNDAVAATGGVWSLPAAGGSASTSVCKDGFVAQGVMGSVGQDGRRYVFGPFSCGGETCSNVASNTGSNSPAATNTPTCVAPKVASVVTFNGVSSTVCYTPVTTTTPPKSSSATASGGSVAAPTSGLGPNAPPTATGSTDSTSCSAGTCTTTKNYTDSTGATVGTTTETKPESSFCQENPASPMCVESRFSGGGCGAPDACSGDAIQCAIQAQAKKTACAFESSAPVATEENAYASARAVTGDQTTGSSINSTVNVSASSFDQTNLLGAEVGLSDLTVTVMGRAATLPLSGLNTWFDVLGKLLMGVTAILCMRIVARG